MTRVNPHQSAVASRPTAYDVLIVGSGPTGLTLAYLLASRGARVGVVDPNRIVCPYPRATHLDDETMRTLQLLGLAASEDSFLCMEGMSYLDQDGVPFVEMVMPAGISDQGWRTDYQFFQPDFEARVRGALNTDSNATLWLGWQVTAIDQHAEGAAVVVADRSSGETATVRASYVVGCDGASSFVRGAMNTEIEDLHGTQTSLIIDVHAFKRPRGLSNSTGFVLYEDGEAPMTYVPIQKPMHRFEFMLRDGEPKYEAEEPTSVYRRLSRWLDPTDYRIMRTGAYEWHAYLARAWRDRRLFIAGDAAHEMPPMLGQGMCSGVRDAMNLAWKLAAVLSGQASDALLDTYETERIPAVRPYIEESARIANVIDQFSISNQRPERSAPHIGATFRPPIGPGFHDHAAPSGGRLAPQPRSRAGKLLDDRVGYNFAVVGTASTLDAVSQRTRDLWEQHNVVLLADPDPAYASWLEGFGCDAVLIRPDRYVYATSTGASGLDAVTARFATDLCASRVSAPV